MATNAGLTDSTLASPGISDGTSGAAETMDDVLASGDTGATTDIAEPEIEIPELDLEGTSEPEKLEVEAPIDARTTPESIKSALRAIADPAQKAELQRFWNQFQAYTAQFKTPAEARQFKELVGEGGIARVKELVDSAADYEQRDASFFSGDPAQQEPMIIEWMQHDPNAVYAAFTTTNNLIKQNFPEEYSKFSSEVARDTLNRFSDGDFGEFMDSMRQAAETGDPAKMAPFAAELARWWGKTGPKLGYGKKNGLNEADPAAAALAKQREQLNRQQNEFANTRWQTFQGGFHESMEKQVTQLSTGIVDKALANAKVSDGLKARIKSDLSTELRKAVIADKNTQAQIQRLIDPSGKRNVSQYALTSDVQRQVVNLLTGRARAVARDVASRVISGWTNDIVGRRKEEISSRQRAAQRPDISGGAPSNWGKSGSLTDKEIAEKGMSMEDVLNDPRPYAGKGKRA
jgi:hypothetical protein